MARRCCHDEPRGRHRRLPGLQAGAGPQIPQRGGRAAAAGRASPPHRGASRLEELTPALLDEFLASRPRTTPRSFNHLLGVVSLPAGLGRQPAAAAGSPLQARRRRATAARIPFLLGPDQARQLLHAAARTAGRHPLTGPRRRPTTPSSPCATGWGCAAERRAPCAPATSTATASCSSSRAASSARAAWSRTARGSAS